MGELKRKKINKRTKIAWKLEISKIESELAAKERKEKLDRQRKERGLDKDNYNRNYITEKIVQYMSEGMQKTDAIKRVIEEEKEIVKSFEYLKDAGLDLRVVFYNWASNRICKDNNRKIANRGEER